MKYLLKRCGHQELGSMGSDLKPQRGQYLMMAMCPEVLSFFPPLSVTQQNDYKIIPVSPVYTNNKVYCRFVYHNDKFHGSTAAHPRNEYRLYLNREVQGGKLLYFEGGIVIFRLVNEENLDEGLYIDYAASGDALYNQYNQLLSASALSAGSNYAVYTGTIKEFEHRVESSSEQERKATVSTEDVNFISKNTQGLESLFNEVSFRDFLMVGYEGKCAITRTAINFGGMVNLEAAHIHPKAHGGNFLPSNGLMLCRDLHWAFDHGFLALTDDCHVMVSRKAPSDMLSPLDGKPIFMPADNFIKPNVDSIRWHRQNVFEHFGSIRAK